MGRDGPETSSFLSFKLVIICSITISACMIGARAADYSSPDGHILEAFRASADPSLLSLRNWTIAGNNSCLWDGVNCDEAGYVRDLVLEGLNLTGPIDMLAGLSHLRLLSLKDNALNGSLPDMTQWKSLTHLYLQNNEFSGTIPDSVAMLARLVRFTASSNRLSGPIPTSIMKLAHLATLRLEYNQLSGLIPPLQLSSLSDFNISHNQFVGSIPPSLDKFGASAFQGNPNLCGRPLFPGLMCDGAVPKTVPSTQSMGPGVTVTKKKSGLSTGTIVAIVVGDAAALLLVIFSSLVYYWKRYPQRHGGELKPGKKSDDNVNIALSSTYIAPMQKALESQRCKLVFLEDGSDAKSRTKFQLEDLLRASAEMLGKGSFGTAYKAVLENGKIVAVKRLKEVSTSSRKDFEQRMEMVGKLRHPNVLPLRAYYYAKEEKLLVYDYQRNGSLYSLLHGNRGPGRIPLDWITRLRIAVGVAKALAHLHHDCGMQKFPHGNIKSSNILMDENYNPLVADFGLALIMNPTVSASSRVAGYRAPEHVGTKRISQQADVYSFGVMLLEILTGKAPAPLHPSDDGIDLPRWVHSVVREEWTAEVFDTELLQFQNIEEDMVSMLQTAMLCIEPMPERRPKMTEVLSLLEKLSSMCADLQSPLGDHDTNYSIPPSPEGLNRS